MTGTSATTALVVKAIAINKTIQGNVSPIVMRFYLIDNSIKKLNEYGITKDSTPEFVEAAIEDFMKQMTLDEKVGITSGIGNRPSTALNNRVAGSLFPIPRLGVPAVLFPNGPAGLAVGRYSTVWVSPTLLASTWNDELVGRVAARVAAETKYTGADIILSPGMNIQRNPLGGRCFEYFSEDPVVAGKISAAYNRGMQGAGVGVSVKHFAANNQESNRSMGETVVSERALREIYLRGFEISVAESKPWTVMSSYNRINSVLAPHNKWLLTDVLRGDWGFNGLVVTDWSGAKDGPAAVIAQNDLIQPIGFNTEILAWINEAGVSAAERGNRIALLERNVKNILRVTVKAPVFFGEYDGITRDDIDERGETYYTSASSPYQASKLVNREAATEGMVLLKNDNNALPLSAGAKVAIVSSDIAYQESIKPEPSFARSVSAVKDLVTDGGGSSKVTWKKGTIDTLEDALKDAGFTVTSAEVDAQVAASAATADDIAAKATAAATAADIGVMVVSRQSGEGSDNPPSSFNLSAVEKTVLEAYGAAFKAAGKKLIVIVNSGAAMNVQEIGTSADAVLVAWLVGGEGGHAIADILSGAVNPSGKLTQTFPMNYDDSASIAMATDANKGNTWSTTPVFYDEGVYVGYRYFDTFEKGDRVAYPFGHGLSYTTFEFSSLTLSKARFNAANNDEGNNAGNDEGNNAGNNEGITAQVTVKNTGAVAGREVVQLYLGASTYVAEGRPVKELKHYAKTRLLQPGEAQTLSFTIDIRDLQYFDDGQPLNKQLAVVDGISNVEYGKGMGWYVAPDTVFTVSVGNTSDERVIAESGLTGTFVYGYSNNNIAVTSVSLNTNSLSLSVGGSATLIATVAPVDADNKSISWSSSDTSVATVSNGVVTAVRAGTTVITVTTADGGHTAMAKVTVTSVSDGGGRGAAGNYGGAASQTPQPAETSPPIEDPEPDETSWQIDIPNLETPLGRVFPFEDVHQGDWFYGAVEYVWMNGLFNGTAETLFSPNMDITRAMIVTVLYRHIGYPDVSGLAGQFSDVDEGEYYANAVNWAAANCIVIGIGDGKYAPEIPVSRQDLALILMNYAKFAGLELPVKREYQSFIDDADIEIYAKEAVGAFYEAMIINGYPDGSFKPNGLATRAEVAAMLYRFMEAVGG